MGYFFDKPCLHNINYSYIIFDQVAQAKFKSGKHSKSGQTRFLLCKKQKRRCANG